MIKKESRAKTVITMAKLIMPLMCLLILVGCVKKLTVSTDELCTPLKEFANSIEKTKTQKIVLKTCWFCGNSLGWVSCESFGYEAGEKFCSYLLKNAQIEFAQDNFDRSIMCLANKSYHPIQNALVEVKNVSFFFINAKGVKNEADIFIKFKNEEDDLPTLLIEVSGEEVIQKD